MFLALVNAYHASTTCSAMHCSANRQPRLRTPRPTTEQSLDCLWEPAVADEMRRYIHFHGRREE